MRGFRVLAIMTAYNEEDIIVPSIMQLIEQGIDVYLIDNWSNDSTYKLAAELQGKGLIKLERFPQNGPTPYFDLRNLLSRVEQVALEQPAAWYVHHDVDEVRCSPWSGVSYREGLYRVDQEGYSCIDHIGVKFHPVDNGYEPGTDFEAYFKYFDIAFFNRRLGISAHRKAWKRTWQRVSLAASGGHDVQFERRQIYPRPFLLKHYPFRSQAQAVKKVFQDRIPRFNPDEKHLGWHVQYDQMKRDHCFIQERDDLELFDEARFMEERLCPVHLASVE